MTRASSRRTSQKQSRGRSLAARRACSSSQPHHLMYVLIAASTTVIALVMAFNDGAESMVHHYHAGQGHTRATGGRRDAAAATGRKEILSSVSTAAVAGAARSGRPVEAAWSGSSSSSSSVCGGHTTHTASGGDGSPSHRRGAAAARTTRTTAFVGLPAWPAVSSTVAAREDASASMMTRGGRSHDDQQQPTQRHQGWFQNPAVAGPAGRRRSSRGGSSDSSGFVQGASSSSRSSSVAVAAGASHCSTRSHGFASSNSNRLHGSTFGSGSELVAPLPSRYSNSNSNSALVCMSAAAAAAAGGGGGGVAGGGGDGRRVTTDNISGLPPLLITIGPQCAGKTSLLRGLAAKSKVARERGGGDEGGGNTGSVVPSVTDVTIDDDPSVYHKIPTGLLLAGCPRGSREDTPVGRGSLSDRLGEPGCVETRLVALRLQGNVSAEEFANRLRGYGGQASPAALAALRDAVESAVSDNVGVSTSTVDVFVRENLFPTAVSASRERLAVAASSKNGLVAWGNTNTQARDYSWALEQAQLTGRPVRFLRWGHELPFLSLEELSRRNVCRFASTGRYIEVAAVENALARLDKLYASTSGGDPGMLALAAGFEMNPSGGVHAQASSLSRSRRPSSPRRRRGNDFSGGGGGGGGGDRAAWVGRGRGHVGEVPEEGNPVAYRSGAAAGVGAAAGAPPPTAARPLPSGHIRFASMNGADQRRYDGTAAAPLGLAQGWTPRGGSDGGARGTPTGASSSRRWDYSDSGGGGGGGAASVPPTVMFGNEWGRKRAWRRTGYNDDDIDPTLSSCFFRTPANSTGELRRNDLGEGVGADLEEMELVRRIKSFRERR
ncbi:unnamed protein product [Pylaiella littoralis]